VALTGRFERTAKAVDVVDVINVIDDARFEEAARRLRMNTAQ
jgi:RIO kinase 1